MIRLGVYWVLALANATRFAQDYIFGKSLVLPSLGDSPYNLLSNIQSAFEASSDKIQGFHMPNRPPHRGEDVFFDKHVDGIQFEEKRITMLAAIAVSRSKSHTYELRSGSLEFDVASLPLSKDEIAALDFLEANLLADEKAVDAPINISPSETLQSSGAVAEFWKCPNCGSSHKKGAGATLARLGATPIIGTVSCGNCKAKYTQNEIIGGKFDTNTAEIGHHLRMVNSEFNLFVGSQAAEWGSGHTAAFNNEWTSIELSWLLDGDLFPAGRDIAKSELQRLISINIPIAHQICLRSSEKFGLKAPTESNAATLAIYKFFLSYAVQNNVSFEDAQAAYKQVMADAR